MYCLITHILNGRGVLSAGQIGQFLAVSDERVELVRLRVQRLQAIDHK